MGFLCNLLGDLEWVVTCCFCCCCFMQVIYDKTTGRSRGFGFVTMSSVEEAEAAAQQFNGYVSLL